MRYISTRETESRHCRTKRPTRGHCMVTYNRLQAIPGSFIVIIFLKILNSNLFYTVRKNAIILRSTVYSGCCKRNSLWPEVSALAVTQICSVKYSNVLNFMFNAPWSEKTHNTSWARTNFLWIYSPPVHHSTTAPRFHEMNFSNIYASILLNYVIFHDSGYKMAENELRHTLLKPIITRV